MVVSPNSQEKNAYSQQTGEYTDLEHLSKGRCSSVTNVVGTQVQRAKAGITCRGKHSDCYDEIHDNNDVTRAARSTRQD